MEVSANVFDATQLNFEADVIQASLTTPVLVDFWAPWCGPCKTLGPILEKVVDDYAGKLRLAKVDTDAEMQLAAVFGIRSLPTVVLVKDGQMVDGFMGALPESGVRQFVEKHVGAPAPADDPNCRRARADRGRNACADRRAPARGNRRQARAHGVAARPRSRTAARRRRRRGRDCNSTRCPQTLRPRRVRGARAASSTSRARSRTRPTSPRCARR